MSRPRARRRTEHPSQPATWTAALTRFLHHLVEHERSPLTIAGYRRDLLHFTAWYQGRFQERPVPALLLPEELREYKAHLRDHQQLEPASVNRRLAALRSFLAWAQDQGITPEIRTPKSVAQVLPPPRWLDEKQQRALARAVGRYGNLRDIALVFTLMDTGIRVDEAVALTRHDLTIGERSGSLRVRRGKGRKQRTIPLGLRVRDALRQYLRTRADDHDAAFVGQRGPLKARALQLRLDTLNRYAQLGELTPHVLRHTFGHNLAAKGVAIQVIADLMGHESLETTRRYVQPGREDLAAAVERLAGGDD
jgi:site-specific recombinase XerD